MESEYLASIEAFVARNGGYQRADGIALLLARWERNRTQITQWRLREAATEGLNSERSADAAMTDDAKPTSKQCQPASFCRCPACGGSVRLRLVSHRPASIRTPTPQRIKNG